MFDSRPFPEKKYKIKIETVLFDKFYQKVSPASYLYHRNKNLSPAGLLAGDQMRVDQEKCTIFGRLTLTHNYSTLSKRAQHRQNAHNTIKTRKTPSNRAQHRKNAHNTIKTRTIPLKRTQHRQNAHNKANCAPLSAQCWDSRLGEEQHYFINNLVFWVFWVFSKHYYIFRVSKMSKKVRVANPSFALAARPQILYAF